MSELPSFMAQHGERLIDNGYRILPIMPGKKFPGRFQQGEWQAYPEWSRHCDRDTKSFEVDIWKRWPGCAIGLACGVTVGIDIDVWDDPNHPDYPRGRPGEDAEISIKLEALAREMLGDTPAHRIGQSPKRALFYRATEPFSGRKRHPLEVYGRGAQLVIHGIHPGTQRPYDWPEESLIDVDISRLPEITEAQALAWLDAAFLLVPDSFRPKSLSTASGVSSWHGPSDPRGTFDAIKSALEYIPNDDLDGSSWIMICNAVKAALGREGRELWVDWSRSSGKSGASGKTNTAEKRFDSAKPRDVGAGSIYYLAEQRGWVPASDLILSGADADLLDAPHPAAAFLAKLEASEKKETLVPLPAVPVSSKIMDVGGIIGEIVDLCVRTAISPQPFLALAVAICCVGTLAGQKYKTRTNLRTNVYAIGIADSGGGKDHARGVVKEAMFAAGLKDYIGGQKIASGSGLLTSLERHSARLFMLDEFGQQIRQMTGPKAPSHKAEIWTNFTELFTSAGGVYLGSEYSDQKLRPRIDLEQPCLSIYGTTVPGPFWSSLESGAMSDGSLARFLVFLTDNDYPDRNKKPDTLEIPENLISALQLIVAGYDSGEPRGNLSGVVKPVPYIVPTTPQADILLDRLTDDQTDWLRSTRGTPSTSVIARVGENVNKLAMIRAISNCPSNPEITDVDVKWATGLVEHCTRTMLREADRHVADNATEATHKRVLDIIRRSGTIGRHELLRKTQFLKAKELGDILAALGEMQLITTDLDKAGGAGRPGRSYSAVKQHDMRDRLKGNSDD